MTTFAGAGIGYRKAYRSAILDSSRADRPRVLEVMPDHFFADPSEIDALAQCALVFHDVGLSVGTAAGHADAVTRSRLDRIRALARRVRPLLVSDHLAITRSPAGIDLGHLCPLQLGRASLALVCDRVRAFQDVLGVPVALENIALPFEIEGELTEPEFFSELAVRAGTGMLLDLTNLVLNARNFGFDPAARLEEYPLETVWQVHLSGGVRVNRFWVDSHTAPVGRAELALLAQLRRRARGLRAIIVERDQNLPPMVEVLNDAREAERVWRSAPEGETACPPI